MHNSVAAVYKHNVCERVAYRDLWKPGIKMLTVGDVCVQYIDLPKQAPGGGYLEVVLYSMGWWNNYQCAFMHQLFAFQHLDYFFQGDYLKVAKT